MLSRPIAVPKPTSRVEAKRARQAEQAKQLRECYQAVDARDGGKCRICGRWAKPNAVGLLQRMHRHHMVYRSQGGEESPENILSVCAACHTAIHVTCITRVSGNANVRDLASGKFCGVTLERWREGGWHVEGCV